MEYLTPPEERQHILQQAKEFLEFYRGLSPSSLAVAKFAECICDFEFRLNNGLLNHFI